MAEAQYFHGMIGLPVVLLLIDYFKPIEDSSTA
jgi:hypothetical protein